MIRVKIYNQNPLSPANIIIECHNKTVTIRLQFNDKEQGSNLMEKIRNNTNRFIEKNNIPNLTIMPYLLHIITLIIRFETNEDAENYIKNFDFNKFRTINDIEYLC